MRKEKIKEKKVKFSARRIYVVVESKTMKIKAYLIKFTILMFFWVIFRNIFEDFF